MKKYMRILICILVCVMSACSPYDRADNISAGKTDYDEIIDSGKYYCIYKGNSTQVYYNIYDKNGVINNYEIKESNIEVTKIDNGLNIKTKD